MRETECELAVGDSIRIGDEIYTLIDVDGKQVSLRVDVADDSCEESPLSLVTAELRRAVVQRNAR